MLSSQPFSPVVSAYLALYTGQPCSEQSDSHCVLIPDKLWVMPWFNRNSLRVGSMAPASGQPVSDQQIARAADHLSNCDCLLVLLGAGSSADSGVPTFRDVDGLWQKYKVEELAHPDAFARHPDLVWDWYRERRDHIAAVDPHPGQRTLSLLQLRFPGKVLIGDHQRGRPIGASWGERRGSSAWQSV